MTGDEELGGDGGRLHGYRSIQLEFSRRCDGTALVFIDEYG
jgi:hypothetical protein